jgi:hypothetical protein
VRLRAYGIAESTVESLTLLTVLFK